MHEFIEHYLDSYISNTEADYAVMLTGEWGSGKTYFVKEYFTDPPAISHRNTRCVDRAGKYFLEYAA